MAVQDLQFDNSEFPLGFWGATRDSLVVVSGAGHWFGSAYYLAIGPDTLRGRVHRWYHRAAARASWSKAVRIPCTRAAAP